MKSAGHWLVNSSCFFHGNEMKKNVNMFPFGIVSDLFTVKYLHEKCNNLLLTSTKLAIINVMPLSHLFVPLNFIQEKKWIGYDAWRTRHTVTEMKHNTKLHSEILIGSQIQIISAIFKFSALNISICVFVNSFYSIQFSLHVLPIHLHCTI